MGSIGVRESLREDRERAYGKQLETVGTWLIEVLLSRGNACRASCYCMCFFSFALFQFHDTYYYLS